MKVLINQNQSLTSEQAIELLIKHMFQDNVQLSEFFLNEVRRLKKEYHNDISLLTVLGLYYYDQGDFEDACHYYERAVAKGGKDNILGLLHALSGYYIPHYHQYSHHHLQRLCQHNNRSIRYVAKQFIDKNKNRCCSKQTCNGTTIIKGEKNGRRI